MQITISTATWQVAYLNRQRPLNDPIQNQESASVCCLVRLITISNKLLSFLICDKKYS